MIEVLVSSGTEAKQKHALLAALIARLDMVGVDKNDVMVFFGEVDRASSSFGNTVTVAAVEAGVPGLADARNLVDRFQAMIRTKAASQLNGWIEQTRVGLIAPLARGVAKDLAAIRAAITEPWSNGQTEVKSPGSS